jgi:hypothetical protein
MMIRIADQKLEEEDYYNALDWYEQAYAEVKEQDVAVKIANLHIFPARLRERPSGPFCASFAATGKTFISRSASLMRSASR